MNILAIGAAKYLYLLGLLIGLVVLWKLPAARKKHLIIYGILSGVLALVIARLAGLVYFDPRPFVIGHFTPLVSHSPDNGFPSDHTLLLAAIAAVLWPYSRKGAVLAGVIAVVVGAARVYVGIHHPVDIIGSIVFAVLAAWLIYRFVMPKVAASRWYQNLFERQISR